ncbi:MAG TPA: NAD(P)-dependent oxidoreductase [Terriglobia bacterium]|nr:NAD(P)-dependent oxidoreductase [Terriglobia bacterium]
MSILVTGGTGFIGSYVVRSLLQHGEPVVCFDRSPDAEVIGLLTSEVEVIAGDVGERQQVAVIFGSSAEFVGRSGSFSSFEGKR